MAVEEVGEEEIPVKLKRSPRKSPKKQSGMIGKKRTHAEAAPEVPTIELTEVVNEPEMKKRKVEK